MRADHDGSDDEGPLRTSNVRRCDGAIVRKHWRGVALTMAIPSLLAGLTACSSGRSVEAFCSTWETETTAFANEYQEAGDNVAAASEDDPLGALLGGTLALTQSVGDVIIVFERLQRVAPADIQPDSPRLGIASRASVTQQGTCSTTRSAHWQAAYFRDSPLAAPGSESESTSRPIALCSEAWVHWYNTSPLMHRLGLIPPAEAEAAYYHQQQNNRPVVHT